MRPFLGCLRALRMNGVTLNLEGKANETEGVRVNCTGHCQDPPVPCQNSGLCVERYSHYSCNCSISAFDGPFCNHGERRRRRRLRWGPSLGWDGGEEPAVLSPRVRPPLQTLAGTSRRAPGCGTTSCPCRCTPPASSPASSAAPGNPCPATTSPARRSASASAPPRRPPCCSTSAPSSRTTWPCSSRMTVRAGLPTQGLTHSLRDLPGRWGCADPALRRGWAGAESPGSANGPALPSGSLQLRYQLGTSPYVFALTTKPVTDGRPHRVNITRLHRTLYTQVRGWGPPRRGLRGEGARWQEVARRALPPCACLPGGLSPRHGAAILPVRGQQAGLAQKPVPGARDG